jgi:type I restriction enzyme S subunit
MMESRAIDEWPTARLDEVSIRGSGHTPSKRRPEYWNGDIPWVSLGDTTRLDRGAITSTAASVTADGIAHSAAVVRPAGTVILLRGSSVGKSAILGRDMAVSQDYVTWTCGPEVHNWFLYYLLQYWKPEFARIGFGNTVKTIGLDYFRHFEIPLPPISEQLSIAMTLGEADALATSIEGLITKKRAIKQGLTQELLTGRARLTGFSDAWSEASIGSLIDGLAAGTSVRSVEGAASPAVLKTSAVRGGRFDAREAKTILPQDVARASCTPVADSLIISRMNTPAMVGDVGYVEHSHPGLYLPDRLWLARPRPGSGTCMRWLAAVLSHGATARAVRDLATGTSNSMKNIPKGRLLALRVLTPPRDEQQAIAEVLRDANAEIEALERRLESTREIKQGMMQEFLTGHTRIVPTGVSA